MRTLNANLQAAMDSGNFIPIVRAALLDPDDHSVIQYVDLLYFKTNGIDVDIEFYDSTNSFIDTLSLERGVRIGTAEYTIFSGIYHLTTSYKLRGGLYICQGSLIEPVNVDVAGDVPYETVINSVMALEDNSAVFKDPAAAWLGYKFLGHGQHYLSSNIYSFLALLRQKYLIFLAENGLTASPPGNSLLFFSAADSLALASQYTIPLTARDTFSVKSASRQFVWRDETGLVHSPGPLGYPVHNLGYLESGNDPPDIPDSSANYMDSLAIVTPNLKYQTGDCVTFDPGIPYFIPGKSILDVTEIFDARAGKSAPQSWYMELRPLMYFANTPGGSIPVSSEYTTAYSQLATNGFNRLLDSSVTNLQALADAVDRLPVSVISGGGTLEFVAADDYVVTVPGTGIMASLEQPNVFTAIQKINVNSLNGLLVERSGVHDNVLVVDTTNGRVGINAANPVQALEIVSGAATKGLQLTNVTTDAAAKYAMQFGLPYTNTDGAYVLLMGYSASGANVVRLGGGGSSSRAATELQFYTAPDTVTNIGTQRVTIDKNGNVGIGVASPTVKLDVSGALKVSDNVTLLSTAAKLLSFWGVTPVAQPTTAVAPATFVANTGNAVNASSTFDGYTLRQVVRALRLIGILA